MIQLLNWYTDTCVYDQIDQFMNSREERKMRLAGKRWKKTNELAKRWKRKKPIKYKFNLIADNEEWLTGWRILTVCDEQHEHFELRFIQIFFNCSWNLRSSLTKVIFSVTENTNPILKTKPYAGVLSQDHAYFEINIAINFTNFYILITSSCLGVVDIRKQLHKMLTSHTIQNTDRRVLTFEIKRTKNILTVCRLPKELNQEIVMKIKKGHLMPKDAQKTVILKNQNNIIVEMASSARTDSWTTEKLPLTR